MPNYPGHQAVWYNRAGLSGAVTSFVFPLTCQVAQEAALINGGGQYD